MNFKTASCSVLCLLVLAAAGIKHNEANEQLPSPVKISAASTELGEPRHTESRDYEYIDFSAPIAVTGAARLEAGEEKHTELREVSYTAERVLTYTTSSVFTASVINDWGHLIDPDRFQR